MLAAFLIGWGWKGTEYIAVVSLTFAILSFAISLWMTQRTEKIAKEETAKASLIQALQAEKESIGYTVQSLKERGLAQHKPSDRKQILESLVLAAIFTGSDRARVMVFSVLLENCAKYRTEIEEIVTPLEKMFEQFKSFNFNEKELDLKSGNLRLGALRRVLKKPEETA